VILAGALWCWCLETPAQHVEGGFGRNCAATSPPILAGRLGIPSSKCARSTSSVISSRWAGGWLRRAWMRRPASTVDSGFHRMTILLVHRRNQAWKSGRHPSIRRQRCGCSRLSVLSAGPRRDHCGSTDHAHASVAGRRCRPVPGIRHSLEPELSGSGRRRRRLAVVVELLGEAKEVAGEGGPCPGTPGPGCLAPDRAIPAR
jgi:hypothetical protein